MGEAVNMLQMTVSRNHPFAAHGILVQLARLGKLESFFERRLVVRCVFVVPRGIEFARQNITHAVITLDTRLSTVSWLRAAWTKTLVYKQVKRSRN